MYKSIDAAMTWRALPIRLVVNPPPEAAESIGTPKPHTVQHGKQTTRTRISRPVKPKPTIREISPSEITGLYTIKTSMKDEILAATDLGLLKSSDLGEHWTLAELPGSTAVTALYSGGAADGILIAKASGGLYLSKDCGEHWTLLPFPLPPSDVNDMAIPADPKSPLLAATRVGLYSSPDSGMQWFSNTGGGLPASTVTAVLYSGSEASAFAVEYGRLYETNNGGNSWTELSSAFPSLRIRHLWMPDDSFNRLYAITSDLGIIFRN
jgi:photosystem II stability/assembly factor-like uncharacterized protein